MSQNNPSLYTLEDFDIGFLTPGYLALHSPGLLMPDPASASDIQPQQLDINSGVFIHASSRLEFPTVGVHLHAKTLTISCPCRAPKEELCEHQVQVLYALMSRSEIRIFFDEKARHEKMRQKAIDYGLESEYNPDDYFQLEYTGKSVTIRPRIQGMFPVTVESLLDVKERLLPSPKANPVALGNPLQSLKHIVVFRQHKYYDHLTIELYEAQTSQDGKVKNPLTPVNPLDCVWKTEKTDELKFYTAIARFQNNYESHWSDPAMNGLKALIANPLQLALFYHNPAVSGNITSQSIVRVQVKTLPVDLHLSVDLKGDFYEVSGKLMLDDKPCNLKNLTVRYTYFVVIRDVMYFIDNVDCWRVITFFKQHHETLLIHQSKFAEFQQTVLAGLEHKIRISYSYVRPATPEQLQQNGFDQPSEQIIYLSDHDDSVIITPVIRYGYAEVPVLSKKQIYSTDVRGKPFRVDRDPDKELSFTALLLRQHPDFREQLAKDSFSLSRTQFLNDAWFLDAFEEWTAQNITILGFNELKNNKLNPNKARISVLVSSGLDWFDTSLNVQFGNQTVSLKHLHKAVRNKSRFVQLGDGTLGILPTEWIAKFAAYFQGGEVVEESLRIPKSNFSEITELYGQEVLTTGVKEQLNLLQAKLTDFDSITSVPPPDGLQAMLRGYQQQGLNWLNFLDDFGFGGCLADDMGLGKTIQILAFILLQRTKTASNTNLVVVPTSLLFNWQAEVAKFAPSLRMLTIYGADRRTDASTFDQHEIILTSYGTLLSDIRFLKQYRFNYIILDESQAIKNPESQRYKAVRLLQSRNKIVLTGTPVENNTFDLYGQFSFACPGLLGNRQFFKEHYAIPIDRFKDTGRARELQKKIRPFILRRTKKQVATELPDKTEMVIYCEMGEEQRKLYDAYATEFRHYLLTKQEGDIPRESMHILQGLTKLRQICNSPALLKDETFYGTSSSKIEALLEEIEARASQHKILIFSQFVTMLDLIRNELQSRNLAFAYLTGQSKNRGVSVDEFQTNEHIRIFLISLKAGGTGLNLTEADYVYLVDPWWNPAVENQAIDRCYRIGQKKNVVAVRLICPGTIEEKMMKLQESKRELAGELIQTDASVLKSLSRQDLMDLLS